MVNDLFASMAETALARDAFMTSGVLDYWLEYAIRQADNDGRNTVDERVSALAFLGEVWTHKPAKIEQREEVANSILTMLKRGCRDRSKPLRFSSFS